MLVLAWVAAAAAQTDPPLTAWLINSKSVKALTPDPAIEPCIGTILADVQEVWYTEQHVYVVATGLPSYPVGPFEDHNPSIPHDPGFLFRMPRNPCDPQTDPGCAGGDETPLGRVGLWVNGVAVYNARDAFSYRCKGIWNQNAVFVEADGFDCALGHPSPDGGATPCADETGVYHHHQRSPALSAQLADDGARHSPIHGFAFDGFPIYGPYAYEDPNDPASPVVRMQSGYRLRDEVVIDGVRHTLPDGTMLPMEDWGPDTSESDGERLYSPGYFLEDFEYAPAAGALDEHNGRYCKTPEYPDGTYAYFTTIDASGANAYPYCIGPTYYGDAECAPPPAGGCSSIPSGAQQYDPPSCSIDYWKRVQKVTAAAPQSGAEFGSDVAIDGELAIAGAPEHTLTGAQPGCVFAFSETAGAGDPWQDEGQMARSPGGDIRMGRSVALSGGRAVTGDELHAPGGGAYFFDHASAGTWTLVTEPPFGAMTGDQYGRSVAVNSLLAAVGAPFAESGGASVGAVSLLRRNIVGWTIEDTLFGTSDGAFGWSVAVDSERVLVGNPFHGLSAHLFERIGGVWTQTALLTAPLPGNGLYGWDVDICGDRLIVTQPYANLYCGLVHVYRRKAGVWSLEQTLVGPRDTFGMSAAVADGVIVVGAPTSSDFPTQLGEAFLYQRCSDRWIRTSTLQVAGTTPGDGFGSRVDTDGHCAIVGAHLDDVDGVVDSGSAYIYCERNFFYDAHALSGQNSTVKDIFNGNGPPEVPSWAAGTELRGLIDVPVVWQEVEDDIWIIFDLPPGIPDRAGQANRIGGAAGALVIAGAYEDPPGALHPFGWQQSAGSWAPILLEQPPGTAAGRALGVVQLVDRVETLAFVGDVLGGGLARPTLWIDGGATPLPGLTAAREGSARDVLQLPGGAMLIVGWSRAPNGVARPVYWLEVAGQFDVAPLPPLAGSIRGFANALAAGSEGVAYAAGEADTSNGETHPVLWTFADGAWSVRDLGLPVGADSASLNDCRFDDDRGTVLAVGVAQAGGVDFGFAVRAGCGAVYKPLADFALIWGVQEATAIGTSGWIVAQGVALAAPNDPSSAIVLKPHATQIANSTAVWACLSGAGNWANSACWSGLVGGDPYPDRGDVTYDVTLPPGAYTVQVDPAGDDEVMVDGAVEMTGPETALEIPAGKRFIVNDQATLGGNLLVPGGALTAGPAADVNIDGATMDVQAGGLLRLPSGGYDALGSGVPLALRATGAGAQIDLPGLETIQGPPAANLTIEAASAARVDLTALTDVSGEVEFYVHDSAGDPSVIHCPQLERLGLGARLRVRTGGSFIGAPLVDVSGVRIEVHSAASQFDTSQIASMDDARLFADGGAVVTFPGVTSYRTGVLDCGQHALRAKNPGSELHFPALATIDAGPCTNIALRAELNGKLFLPGLTSMSGIVDIWAEYPSALLELGVLNLDAGASLIVQSGAEVRVLGSVSCAITNATAFRWESDTTPTTLSMLGGEPGNCATLEVGGADLGDVPAGWVDNFQLERLVIGADAHVMLVDAFDNSPGGEPEALYVDTLEFSDPGTGRLDLNGLNLYYNILIGDPGQLHALCRPLAPGQVQIAPTGDAQDVSEEP